MAKKKKLDVKRIGEIMENMDSPHSEYDLGESFQRNGAGAPAGPRPSQALLDSFRNTYEPVGSEHMAQELFSMGRLREYFQAWIIPKMPDPLPVYMDELSYMGFNMRTSFDGSPCIMVRYRGAVDVRAEEVEEEDTAAEHSQLTDVPVYTDDWEDDMSDVPAPDLEE